jgi:hypothetical protein
MNRVSIKSLFDKFSVGLEPDDTWQVQAATVIRHKALERLAAGANIRFDPPTILRADRDEAVILSSGSLATVPSGRLARPSSTSTIGYPGNRRPTFTLWPKSEPRTA